MPWHIVQGTCSLILIVDDKFSSLEKMQLLYPEHTSMQLDTFDEGSN